MMKCPDGELNPLVKLNPLKDKPHGPSLIFFTAKTASDGHQMPFLYSGDDNTHALPLTLTDKERVIGTHWKKRISISPSLELTTIVSSPTVAGISWRWLLHGTKTWFHSEHLFSRGFPLRGKF